jgi:glutamate synthase domain-containing protein 2
VGTNLRDKIRIGASGKIVTAFDVARTLAMGADWCNAARGFMFALVITPLLNKLVSVWHSRPSAQLSLTA